MSEEIKSVDKKIDDLEAAAKKYASKDTVISIGGYEFTPAKLMVAFTLISSILGGLYGAFNVYKDYQSMKKQIQEYVTPDLSGINERLVKIEERIQSSEKASSDTMDYVRDIRNGLQGDVRELAKVVDDTERRGRELDRDLRSTVNTLEAANVTTLREVNARLNSVEKENDVNLKSLEKKVDDKISKAWENPLAK